VQSAVRAVRSSIPKENRAEIVGTFVTNATTGSLYGQVVNRLLTQAKADADQKTANRNAEALRPQRESLFDYAIEGFPK
jgi:hypothetical protein